MTGWWRLHEPPRRCRRWMVDVGLFFSRRKLSPDAPLRVRHAYQRSVERWSRRPEARELDEAFANTLRQGLLGTYSGFLWIETEP